MNLQGVVHMIQNYTIESFALHIHRPYKPLKMQILFTIQALCDLGVSSFTNFVIEVMPLLSDFNDDAR